MEQFLKKIEHASDQFSDKLSTYENIISISHDDADGICSSLIIQNMAKRLGKECQPKIFSYNMPWGDFFRNFPKLSDRSAIIMTDLGSNIKEMAKALETNNITNDMYILDHHLFNANELDLYPENIHFVNITEFGFDGLRHGCASTITLQFAMNVNRKCKSDAWIAVIGASGDTLKHAEQYEGLNKEALDLAVEENQVVLHEGLCLYGASHLRLENGLHRSILPFIKKLKGNKTLSKVILERNGINPKMKIEAVDIELAEKIQEIFQEKLIGTTIKLPKKTGLLKNVFEHGLMASILGAKQPTQAFELISRKSAQTIENNKFLDYIDNLTTNLGKILSLPKIETDDVILIETDKDIPNVEWSSIASYSSVNCLFDKNKIVMIGGRYKPTEDFAKFSVRCQKEFVDKYEGGVNRFIQELTNKTKGWGGGHALAGGISLPLAELEKIRENPKIYLYMPK